MVRKVAQVVLLLTASGASLSGCSSEAELDFYPLENERADAGTEEDASADASEPRRDASSSPADGGVSTSIEDGGEPDASEPMADAGRGTDPVLRYDFSGTGTTVRDKVGNRHATVHGGVQLDDSGTLALNAGERPFDDYVELPRGVISSLTDLTIVVWFEWSGTCWERVFDFGSQFRAQDSRLRAETSLFFTAATCEDQGRNGPSALGIELNGLATVPTPALLTRAKLTQIAVSYEQRTRAFRLYRDGVEVQRARLVNPTWFNLRQIRDENCWLGRSQWEQDFYSQMRFDEFRLYDRALGAAEIGRLYQNGPNAM